MPSESDPTAPATLLDDAAEGRGDDAGPRYYIQDTRSYVGNAAVWWGPDGSGYTTHLDEAGEYSEADACRQHRSRRTDVAVPVEEARAAASLQVDVQRLRKVQSAALRVRETGCTCDVGCKEHLTYAVECSACAHGCPLHRTARSAS